MAGPSAPAIPGPPPLKGLKLALAGFAIGLANFVVVLDITIANVSVPHISGSLAVAPSQGTWVITSYAVAEAISVPLTGWLAGRFGAVRLFMAALFGFGCFSFLCGFAPNLQTLLLCRICQGLCGGPIMPMAQTMMLRIFPREKAAQALGMWSMTIVLGPIAGPILGGLISDNWSWPWIFFINLPVVALSLTVAWRMLRPYETPTVKNPIDYVGLILLVVWVGAFQIMIDKGREEDWFASTLIWQLAIVAAIGFVAFLIWELTDEHPVVDLSVMRHRGFTVGMFVAAISFGAYFATVVLVPLFLQLNLGYTATYAGYATAVTGFFALILSPVAAALLSKLDARLMISGGLLWLSFVTWMRTGWTSDISFFWAALPQFAQGMGMPFFFVASTSLALGAVLPQETASAAGLMNFLRTLCAAIGTSLATTFWDRDASSARESLVGTLNDPGSLTRGAEAGGLSPAQATGVLDRLVQSEAVTLATNHVVSVCAVLFLCTATLVWLAPKPKRAGPSAAH
ncbi:DHA2 family efflux MFS transporter permease subunit [Sphingomonas jatrophae]|uniref:MFS transporter, DHA2 family, multidrug resistance protein n=1 Tax=Sphingomonas jatrophae TaxID=1166337 RepID=A0A1I6MBF4_9SPHN|nr:DHA2 family efflux MFS transporter permease subunit [Sphingomonas jatrophae]SFS13059.1 MFS transporter, DHA2 family, multidrug resistance protein [Sphingomonas jatrophae]